MSNLNKEYLQDQPTSANIVLPQFGTINSSGPVQTNAHQNFERAPTTNPNQDNGQAAAQEGQDDLNKSKRSYLPVGIGKKRALIQQVEEGMTIKEAAQQLGINYSTAKHIVKLYRSSKEARLGNSYLGSHLQGNVEPILNMPQSLNISSQNQGGLQTLGTGVGFS